jgi:hypothetical protein
MKNSQVLKEIIVNADEESLNSAIAEKHTVPGEHRLGDFPTAQGSCHRRL